MHGASYSPRPSFRRLSRNSGLARVADGAAKEPLFEWSCVTTKSDQADDFPPSPKQIELLPGRNVFVDGYVGGAPVWILEREQRTLHGVHVSASQNLMRRGPFCDTDLASSTNQKFKWEEF